MTAFLIALWLSATVSAEVEQQYRQAEAIRAVQPVRARGLYERAARAGHSGAAAALGMLMFRDGNRTGALRWLKLAADQGEARGLLLYGTALFNGDGVPVNRTQGFAMVTRAAAGGLSEAIGTRDEMELVMGAAEIAAAKRLASAVDPALPSSTAIMDVKTTRPSGAWQVQLGAFRQPGGAQALFGRLAPQLPGKQASYVPLGSLTRLLVGPFGSKEEAQATCRALGARQACFPVAAK
ncbi:SPOR domain-containing protein [Sphingomonas sp. BN140010]|uniref:SPOR domain-containing protein n=1 Tax=Sphingomonas arvum TaxID=2992113 RepID=A0ABT3JEN4_9SPHN|nr:SPOR domain-containing protein [Sphingomonas sp. BN140010]MCW3797389.1 SPOR domain-containing protein [Sphingomonas sp. BN140010]